MRPTARTALRALASLSCGARGRDSDTRGSLPVYRMAASFYSSPLIGATTTLACFAHEIPHEIADYSILVRSGFTKKQAMQSQFLTAIGAFVRLPSRDVFFASSHVFFPSSFTDECAPSPATYAAHAPPFLSLHIGARRLGEYMELETCHQRLNGRLTDHALHSTFMGIGIRNLSAMSGLDEEAMDLAAAVRQTAAGLLGTTVQLADLVSGCIVWWWRRWLIVCNVPRYVQVIPFVAGGFMYIGAVAVLPTYVWTFLTSVAWTQLAAA